jgi:hypothetical protein
MGNHIIKANGGFIQGKKIHAHEAVFFSFWQNAKGKEK